MKKRLLLLLSRIAIMQNRFAWAETRRNVGRQTPIYSLQFLCLLSVFLTGGMVSAQTPVYYAEQTGNYSYSYTNSGGNWNQNIYQIGLWAHGSSPNYSVLWRKFTTDGGTTNTRSLNVGDIFTITVSTRLSSTQIGFSLLCSPTTHESFSDIENNIAISVLNDNSGYWYAKYSNGSGGTSAWAGSANVGGSTNWTSYTFVITITAPDRANVTISDGSTTSYLYDVLLRNSQPITEYCIFLNTDDGNNAVFWCSSNKSNVDNVTNNMAMTLGNSGSSFTENNILPDGTAANSTSSTSINSLTKIGTGTLTLSAANTYTGTTTVSAGTLQAGIANAISSSSNVVMNGGTFSTGSSTGYSQSVGTLALSANSTIALGTGSHTLTFANSSGTSWTSGTTLTITGWTGTISGGTAGQIFVGTAGLTTSQLAQINFSGYSGGAVLLSTGEIVPVAGYFRSQTSGDWATAATWQSSNDNTTWATATAAPTSAAASITIMNGNLITIGTSSATASSLTINGGGQLTLNSGNTLTATNFTINSDPTNGTGTFVDANTSGGLTVSGTTNVNQYLTSGRAWYISSPVSEATSNVVSASSSYPLDSYSESGTSWTSISNTTTALGVMTGYSAKIASNGTVTFTGGALNTGALSLPLTRTGTSEIGFNLVGNPYSSYLDYTAALASSFTANLEPTVWYRTQNTSNVYVFDTYNTTSGQGTNNNMVAPVTQYIAPMQAVWVRVASGNTSGTFAVDNTMRSHQSQSTAGNRLKAVAHYDVASAGPQSTGVKLLKSSGSSTTTQSVLRLKVSNGVNSDEAIVLFNPNATNGLNPYDSEKMSNNDPAIPEIYTLTSGQQLVINGLNSIDTVNAMPLGFTTGTNNTFTIMANEVSNFDPGIRIFLNDNLQNTSTDLTGGAVYTFSSDVVSTTSRFSISFKTLTEVASGINTTTSPSISIFRSGNDQITVTHSDNGTEGEISIYSTLGQKVLVTPTTGETTVINAPFSPGIYIVSVKIEGKLTTKKVVID